MNFNQWEKVSSDNGDYPIIYPVPCTRRHDNSIGMVLHIVSEIGEAVHELNAGYPFPYEDSGHMDNLLEEITDVITMCCSTLAVEGVNVKKQYAQDILIIAERKDDESEAERLGRNTRLLWLMNNVVDAAGRLITHYMYDFNSHSEEFRNRTNSVILHALYLMKAICGDWNTVAVYQKMINEKNYGRGYF